MRYTRAGYNRRRPVKRTRNEHIGFNSVILLLISAVIAGYLTTRFILYPLLGFEFPSLETIWDKYRPEVSKDKDDSNDETENDKTNSKETVVKDDDDIVTQGYAIQFGSFSSKDAAYNRVAELKEQGIETSVIKKDSSYKVVGEIFTTKDKAKTAMADIDDDSMFVTAVE